MPPPDTRVDCNPLSVPGSTARFRSALFSTDIWLVASIGALAALLRCYQLGQPGIWFDESSSYRWIQFPLGELIGRTAVDCHPPFYWILLKAWAFAFGSSVSALRAMGVLFGVATVASAYGLVRELARMNPTNGDVRAGRFGAALAALLIAVSPFQTEWSQEMRMYSLGTFQAVTSTWLLVAGLRRDRNCIGIWCWYTLFGIVSLYTLYFSVFTLAAHGLFVVGRGFASGKWPAFYFVAALLILGAFAPWLPYLWSMYGTVQHSFPQGSFTWAEFQRLFWQMFVPANVVVNWILAPTVLVEFFAVVVLVLVASRRPEQILVALCAFVPFYAIVNVSMFSQNLVARHRLILGQVFLLIGLALVIQRFRPPAIRWSVAAAAVAISGTMTACYLSYRDTKAAMPGMREAMHLVLQSRAKGAPVIFVNPMLYLNGVVYAGNAEWLYAAGERSNYPYYQGSSLTRESDHLRLDAIPADLDSVWVVDADKWLGSSWRITMPPEWTLAGENRFPDYYGEIVVKLYRRRRVTTTGLLRLPSMHSNDSRRDSGNSADAPGHAIHRLMVTLCR